MDKGKIFTIFLWIIFGINYLLDFSNWVNYFALLLLTVHVIEYIVFFKKIKNSGDSLAKGIFQTLVFGVLYISSLRK